MHGPENSAESFSLPTRAIGESDNTPGEEIAPVMIAQCSKEQNRDKKPLPQTKSPSRQPGNPSYSKQSQKKQKSRLKVPNLLDRLRSPEKQFLAATANYDVPKIEELLKRGVNIDVEDENGWTALHSAAKSGVAKVIRLLIEKGANVNTGGKVWFRRTPLHVAAASDHEERLTVTAGLLLLENGAEVDAKDTRGETALIIAAERGRREMVRQLLEKGADIEAKSPT